MKINRLVSFLLCVLLLILCSSCAQKPSVTGTFSSEAEKKSEEKRTKETETTPAASKPLKPEVREETDNMASPTGLYAGFARETVNPEPGTCLGGWSTAKDRKSDQILDDIKLTCTALSDGVSIFLFYSVDSLYVKHDMVNKVAKMMESSYGISPENIVLNATHTHSAPAIHFPSLGGMSEYLSRFYPALERITASAIEDLEEATAYISRTETKNLNYVRRYVASDGSYVGGSGIADNQNPEKVFHESAPDTELQVIRFDRKTEKDIILCNWQCHVTATSGEYKTDVSSDWVGALRDAVEQDLNVLFSYHQGAAGNVVRSSKIAGEKDNPDYVLHGKELAEAVKEAMKNETAVQSGKFYAVRVEYTCRTSLEYRLSHTNAGILETFYLSALSIGEIAFATNPCEMHDTNGMQVKALSPFKMTFICAYTNGTVHYSPADHEFDNGGYEVSMCHFDRGTGEKIVGKLQELLQYLHEKK